VVASDFVVERDGVRLVGIDFGGQGSPCLLLHGLAGYAGEWSGTAGWLSEHHRVVAFDARGHGDSEHNPGDVSLAAHVADAACVIEQLDLAPCVVIGQSFGGLAALLLTARRPELTRALIVVEAGPAAPDEATINDVEQSLSRWPVPFATRQHALEFFRGRSFNAEVWTGGLEQRDDGWWTRFDVAVMARTLREAPPGSYMSEWERISCRTLIVRATNGSIEPAYARLMIERLRGSKLVEIADAGHDVHLNRPIEWRQAVEAFLGELQ
jgi:pimeloyl-ACP methyl ester carboxylesterase